MTLVTVGILGLQLTTPEIRISCIADLLWPALLAAGTAIIATVPTG
jgi:high-affinity nickel permease